MTKVPLGLVLLLAGLTMLALVALGDTSASALASNSEVEQLADPRPMALRIAATGALAGLVMLAAYRRSYQAGPLIAMALIPAAALVGVGLAVGRVDLALAGCVRFAIDWGFILGLGVPFLWLKQRLVHRRRPIV